MVLIPCSAGDAHQSRELLCLDIVPPLLSRKMDEIRFEMTSCWLVEGPFPNSWINQPDSFLFFLLLILGINIIRDMQGF